MTACAQIQKERKKEYCKEIAHLLNKDHECLLFSTAALGSGSTGLNKEVPTGVSRFHELVSHWQSEHMSCNTAEYVAKARAKNTVG